MNHDYPAQEATANRTHEGLHYCMRRGHEAKPVEARKRTTKT